MNFQQSFSLFVKKPGGVKSSSEAEDRDWSVVLNFGKFHVQV
jgi:hypothetical protein